MGISALYNRAHVFAAELDSDWATIDAEIHYRINAGDGDAEPQTFELLKVTTRIAGAENPVNITPLINFDYIMDLVEEDASNADTFVGDYV
jgi:hypothetical protein